MLHTSQYPPRLTLSGSTAGASPSSSASSRRVSCLGIISPRSATLILALLGCLAHIQQSNYLAVLHDTFPHVPKVRSSPPGIILTNVSSPPVGSTLPVVGLDVAAQQQSSSSLAAAAAAAAATSVHSADRGIVGLTNPASMNSDKYDDTVVRPIRWFNLLPSRFPLTDSKISSTPTGAHGATAASAAAAFIEKDWKARQRDQEEDRKSWEAARTLTTIVRLYAIVCAVMCFCGIIGVVRSSLLCTRLFVLSSTLDLFLCALSLVSLGIVVTYPNIRGLICEELSNSSAVILELDRNNSQDMRAASGPAVLLADAASTFWKRSVSQTVSSSSDSLPTTYWWDPMLDNLLEYENCDNVLESVLIPLGLVISLIYLALRIHFLVVIRHFYISLLRDQMSLHLGSKELHSAAPALTPSKFGERKYSSSSASSGTGTSELVSCFPSTNKSLWADTKHLNEKMA